MSDPIEHAVAGLLQKAIDEGTKEATHAAVEMMSAACGYLLPRVSSVDVNLKNGHARIEFHSPWRSLNRKPLPKTQQRVALLKVRLALTRYFRLFPQSAVPPISVVNCPTCISRAPIKCAEMAWQEWRQRCTKVVQDAIDQKGWVAGSLDVDKAHGRRVEIHGYLIDAKTAKPVSAVEWEAFAQMFDAALLGPDQQKIQVVRCQKCARKSAAIMNGIEQADRPSPDAQDSCGSQSFAA